MLVMDEDHFKSGFEAHAIWTQGKGEFASLAYCRHGLTIQRYSTLKGAIQAKQAIDSTGCGGGCVKMHVIVRIASTNSRKARELANIRSYRCAQRGEQ
jgi:hypothetical protein